MCSVCTHSRTRLQKHSRAAETAWIHTFFSIVKENSMLRARTRGVKQAEKRKCRVQDTEIERDNNADLHHSGKKRMKGGGGMMRSSSLLRGIKWDKVRKLPVFML